MKLGLYSILDKKAGVYSSPFSAMNAEVACRMVCTSMSDPNSNLGKFPDDYQVWCIGEFDDTTGNIQEDVYFVVALSNISKYGENGYVAE